MSSLMLECQPFVVNPHSMKDCHLKVMDVNWAQGIL